MLGQNDHPAVAVEAIWTGCRAAPFGGLAGFQGHHVGAGGADRQRRADAGQHVGALKVAVQQQHLHQRAGSSRVAVGFPGGGPKASWVAVNALAARAWANAVAPGKAPGLRCRISR